MYSPKGADVRTGEPKKICLVGPFTLTRQGLRALLVPIPEFQIVLDLGSVLENFELVRKSQPDILLIDTSHPADDLETVSQLRKLFPETKILLLTDGIDEEFELQAIRAGARGCLSKKSEPQVLFEALKVVHQGEIWISHHVATLLIGKFVRSQSGQTEDPDELSQRELEILALVANGQRNKEIARRLFISDHTVKAHLCTIFRKLHVSTRLEAALHYFHLAREKSKRPAVDPPSAAAAPAHEKVKSRIPGQLKSRRLETSS